MMKSVSPGPPSSGGIATYRPWGNWLVRHPPEPGNDPSRPVNTPSRPFAGRQPVNRRGPRGARRDCRSTCRDAAGESRFVVRKEFAARSPAVLLPANAGFGACARGAENGAFRLLITHPKLEALGGAARLQFS